jgi:microcystin-dependent protein
VPWNGSGSFNRIFSWVADKAAGLDISSSRMDADTNDISANGFGNCLTRDGQGQPAANLPMNGFRHTGVQNAVNRTDYAAFGQVQDGLSNWTIAGGTADALTATYTPALTALGDGQLCFVRAVSANATTTPTFAPNGLTARTITRLGGAALGIGDIAGALAEIILRYNVANTRWELLNPSNATLNQGILVTGAVVLTLASTAPAGWLMFNDGSMGSASSGASYQDNNNQALFNILFAAPFTDATCPLLTSTGSATTRAAQGTAAAAWAANCRMSLPKTLGRALAVAGSGSGLSSRSLGQTFGEETHLLATSEMPSHNHGVTDPGHSHSQTIQQAASTTPGGFQYYGSSNSATTGFTTGVATTGISIQNQGGGGAHNNMQPSTFMNAIVKQ